MSKKIKHNWVIPKVKPPKPKIEKKVEMKLYRIFPTLVIEVDCSELIDPIVALVDKVKWKNEKSNDSTEDKYVLKDHKDLIDKFTSKVNICLEPLQYQIPLQMTTSWFTRTPNGDRVNRHKHANCLYSSVFYFHDDTSSINFLKDDGPMIDIPFRNNDPQVIPYGFAEIPATKGKLLVFPSSLYHSTKPNNSNKYRYSMAMNYMPRGYCSNYDSSYFYQ